MENQPTVLGVNTVYLLVLIIMIVAQFFLSFFLPIDQEATSNYYWRLFLLEFFIIGLPPLIYMLWSKMKIKDVARFNSMKPVEIILVLALAFTGYWVIIPINLAWYWVVSHIGTPIGQDLPAISSNVDFMAASLAIGLVPALVEEFLFRGLVLRGYEKFGSKKAVILTGIMFGVLHLQLMSIPSIILLGIMISFVVYRTNSIWAGVIYHFVHNTMTVGMLYLQNFILDSADLIDDMPTDFNALPEAEMIIAIAIWVIIGLLALAFFLGSLIIFTKYTKGKGRVRETLEFEKNRSKFMEFLPALLAIFIVLVNITFEILHMLGYLQG